MIINHNLSAMSAQRLFNINHREMNSNIEKLSSGLRINRAKDDAAGLSVSEKMRAQVRGLNQASRNIQDGISLVQTAEGWLQEVEDIVHRMRELAVQAANGVYQQEDRDYIQKEVVQLKDEINRIAKDAEFNGIKLLTSMAKGGAAPVETGGKPAAAKTAGAGEMALNLVVHVGANADQNVGISIAKMNTTALKLTDEFTDLTKRENANKAIMGADEALKKINEQRATLGAFQNRLEHSMKGVNIASENLSSAESQIRDTNMALEMVDFVKNQILSQSSASMLAQANLKPQIVLRVLG